MLENIMAAPKTSAAVRLCPIANAKPIEITANRQEVTKVNQIVLLNSLMSLAGLRLSPMMNNNSTTPRWAICSTDSGRLMSPRPPGPIMMPMAI